MTKNTKMRKKKIILELNGTECPFCIQHLYRYLLENGFRLEHGDYNLKRNENE